MTGRGRLRDDLDARCRRGDKDDLRRRVSLRADHHRSDDPRCDNAEDCAAEATLDGRAVMRSHGVLRGRPSEWVAGIEHLSHGSCHSDP
jgi:hypothetical protein